MILNLFLTWALSEFSLSEPVCILFCKYWFFLSFFLLLALLFSSCGFMCFHFLFPPWFDWFLLCLIIPLPSPYRRCYISRLFSRLPCFLLPPCVLDCSCWVLDSMDLDSFEFFHHTSHCFWLSMSSRLRFLVYPSTCQCLLCLLIGSSCEHFKVWDSLSFILKNKFREPKQNWLGRAQRRRSGHVGHVTGPQRRFMDAVEEDINHPHFHL